MSGQLFIGRLPRDCRAADLEDHFKKCGKIIRCDVKSGFGFIEFDDQRDAEDAIRDLDGSEFEGGRIIVEWAKGRRQATPNTDRRGAGLSYCFCGSNCVNHHHHLIIGSFHEHLAI
eukprot:TRINITY_DN181_c0_g1_i2.p2 TRINITY_DN181_c0_g1~~TRINITY_DN181_c0_g1_i2.p2  ORF type:complete len:134 (-),score=23.89 TRINITY_DN181_c0_g1_i2:526-873(-)